jgi:hypothetical protein
LSHEHRYNAPVDIVWTLLNHPEGWADFYDVRVIAVDPTGPGVVGQKKCEATKYGTATGDGMERLGEETTGGNCRRSGVHAMSSELPI